MSGKKLGGFSTFDGATPPVSPAAREERPAEASAAKPDTVSPIKPARARRKAQAPGQIDPRLKAFWRTNLQNAARKLAIDRNRVLESEDAWVDTVTDARDAGVPENVIVAAAADADVELPE